MPASVVLLADVTLYEQVLVSCTLQLSEGEATAGADTAVVCSNVSRCWHSLSYSGHTLDGRASHNRAKLVDGAGSDAGSLGDTGSPSAGLAARLYRSLITGFAGATALTQVIA